MRYINIHRLTELPDISDLAPFKTILLPEDTVSEPRQAEISTWLVKMGCRYVMSRGETCDSWCESVRRANLALFDLDTMSPRDFVMTTRHRYESVKYLFGYAKKFAVHPEVKFKDCVVLHLHHGDRSTEYLSMYQRA